MSDRLFENTQLENRGRRDKGRGIATDLPVEPRLLDRLLFVTLILFSFGTWLFDHGRSTDAQSASPLSNGLWALASLLGFAGVCAERDIALRLLRGSRPLVIILILTLLSTLWSDQPELTARRSLQLIGSSALGLYFVCRLGFRALVETLAIAISIAAALSIVLIAFFPQIATAGDSEGAWAGFFSHKNRLGPAMVLGIVTIVCLADRARKFRRLLQLAAIVVFLGLIIGSRNGAGVAMIIVFALVIPFLFWSRARRLSKNGFVVAAVLAAVSFAGLALGVGLDEVFSVIGKDATLTGRTDLWQLLIDAIRQRPALGYGYGAFWSGPDSPATRLVYPYMYWLPGMAHNGFLEVALNIGILGVALLIWLLVVGLRRATALFWRGQDSLSAWPLFLMLYIVVTNITDANLLAYRSVDWMMFIAAFSFATDAYQHGESRERQSRQPGLLPA